MHNVQTMGCKHCHTLRDEWRCVQQKKNKTWTILLDSILKCDYCIAAETMCRLWRCMWLGQLFASEIWMDFSFVPEYFVSQINCMYCFRVCHRLVCFCVLMCICSLLTSIHLIIDLCPTIFEPLSAKSSSVVPLVVSTSPSSKPVKTLTTPTSPTSGMILTHRVH